jgi:hypothetical protein
LGCAVDRCCKAAAVEYGKWFADPARFEELDRRPVAAPLAQAAEVDA